MPIKKRKKGQSKKEYAGQVIGQMVREGKPKDQAVAIGMSKAGLSKKRKKG